MERAEAIELKWDLVAAAVAIASGGILAAVLVNGAHVDHVRAVMMLSAVVGLTGGLYTIYGAVKLLRPSSAAVVARDERAQQRDAELKREAWLQAAALFSRTADTSPMEMRMTGSLKSIRDEAEQGLFESDAEKAASHLRTIWAMAASDLDDDASHVQH